jgi:hypothetical protein
MDGETVAIGGLIAKRDIKQEVKVPWLGDLPLVGAAFRYRTQSKEKRELLVILTPHIVRSREEAERILAAEAQRISWMVGDVLKIHDAPGLEQVLTGRPHGNVDGSLPCPLPAESLAPPGATLPPRPVNGQPADTLPAPRAVPSGTPGPPQPPPGVLKPLPAPAGAKPGPGAQLAPVPAPRATAPAPARPPQRAPTVSRVAAPATTTTGKESGKWQFIPTPER